MSKYIIRSAVAFLLCASCAALMIRMPRSAKPSSFDGFAVVFVDKRTNSFDVERLLKEAGCSNVIDENTLSLPLTESMVRSFPVGEEDAAPLVMSIAAMNIKYLESRNDYFTDSNNEYSLYYVPAAHSKRISRLVKKAFRGGVAGKKYEAHYALSVFIMALLLCFIAKSISFAIFPILLVVVEGTLTSSICAILMLLALFASRNLWKRPHSVKALFARGRAPILAAAAMSAAAIGGITIMAAACLLGSLFAIRLCRLVERAKEAKHFFNPVPILLASHKKERHAGLSLAMGAVMCILLSVMGEQTLFVLPNEGAKNIKMKEVLPGIEDYSLWCWQCLTYPYTKVSKTAQDTLLFPAYKEEDGVIVEDIKEAKRDESFFSWCINEIDTLPEGEVEHLMKARRANGPLLFEQTESASFFPVAITAFIAFAAAASLFFVRRAQ